MPRWYSPSGFGPRTGRASVFMEKNHGASGSVSRDSSAHSAVTLPRTRNPSTSSSSVSASARTMAAMSSSIVRTSPHPSSVATPRSTSTPVIDASLRWLPRIGSQRREASMTGVDVERGVATEEGWGLVRTMLDDMAAMVRAEAETELELVEGFRVLGRVTALCAELSLDTDPEAPWFFSMNTEARLVGGPNPDGEYHLGMIDGTRRYRVSGRRGTVTYLGFQVLAGRGLTPRRMAAYVSDRDLVLDRNGRFAFVLSTEEPGADELGGATWVPVPDDSSGIVVRQYIADRDLEELAEFTIECIDPVGEPPRPTDSAVGEQLTAMGWT